MGRGEVSHNCGELGHLRKDCVNETACYLCKQKGHKADSMTCPVYKGMGQELRAKSEVQSKRHVADGVKYRGGFDYRL